MARTAEGRSLTGQHRRAQLQVRAIATRDFIRLWPLWTGDERSFSRLVEATLPLVTAHRRLSGSLAAAYYEAFRTAERVGGSPTPRLADTVEEDRLATSLWVTAMQMTRKAVLSGQPPEKAMRTALVRTSGSVSRHVLDGGRDTLIRSSGADRQARGWARVTDNDPCPFCLMLASRGAVYSEDTVDFHAHDHCGCTVMPIYAGAALPESSLRARKVYEAAQRWARDSGEGAEGTSNDLLNNVRRYVNR